MAESKEPEYVYSHDEETFESFEAAAQGLIDHDYKQGYLQEIELSRGVPVKHKAANFAPCGGWMVDHMREQAYDRAGEHCDDWLDGLPDGAGTELAVAVEKMVNEWADKHNLHPTFYTVKDVQEVKEGNPFYVDPCALHSYVAGMCMANGNDCAESDCPYASWEVD